MKVERVSGEGKCQCCDSPFIVSVVATTSVLLYRTVVVSLLIVATEGGEEEGRRGSDVHLWQDKTTKGSTNMDDDLVRL